MNWGDFVNSFHQARTTLNQADSIADDMARMLQGRLRKCSSYQLAALKKELRDFNASTRLWKDEK